MKLTEWQGIKGLRKLLATRRPEPTQQARRIATMQLNIVLPAKAGVVGVVLFYLFLSGWFYVPWTVRAVAQESLQEYFMLYVACNAAATVLFLAWRHLPPVLMQWVVFTLGLLDGLFMAGLTFITGGFASTAYWIFPGLILLNAVSIPLAMPQVVLNLLLSLFYLSAGILDANIPFQLPLLSVPRPNTSRPSATMPGSREYRSTNFVNAGSAEAQYYRKHRPLWENDTAPGTMEDVRAEPFLLRLFVLWLLTACCYGVQVLAERQRRVAEEQQESAVREAQLRSAGRLAAEFAHQIKNPLAIINNATYSLRRAVREGRSDVTQQIEIIQEEVEHSDRIVTQLMGYAQLSEGRVERLDVVQELDAAVEVVFPPAADYQVRIQRKYEPDIPPLLMQRAHLSAILVNLLQNAREALDGSGSIRILTVLRPDSSVEIAIADDGPGIPADKLERIFEAYYTTKPRGTGLGLAIVRHNIELYGGTVRVESELGKGARFVLILPAKAVIGLKPA